MSQIIQNLSSNIQEWKKFQWLKWKMLTHYKSLSDAEELYSRFSKQGILLNISPSGKTQGF